MILAASGGVERAPNVSLVSWGLDIEVVEPVKNRRPCGWESLGEGCGDDCRVGL